MKTSFLPISNKIILMISALLCSLIHGLLNRWTDIFFLPRPAWGEAFNPNNATHSLILYKTLRKYLFRYAKGKSLANFDINNALDQN